MLLAKIKLLLFMLDKETRIAFLKLILSFLGGALAIFSAMLILGGKTKLGLLMMTLSILSSSLSIAIGAVKSIVAISPTLMGRRRK